MRRMVLAFLVVTLGLLTACATLQGYDGPYEVGYTQKGKASWYGPGFHGKTAANGEIYDQDKLTAAHRHLPFGTLVEVTRRDTGHRVVVRITDRGPFVRGRIIDLSREAARKLDSIGPGVVPVRLKIIAKPGAGKQARGYAIQLGKFDNPEGAESRRRELSPLIPGLRLVPADPPGAVRLVTRSYGDYDHAARIAHRIRRDLNPGAFVIGEPTVETR